MSSSVADQDVGSSDTELSSRESLSASSGETSHQGRNCDVPALRARYRALGEDKWKECIDARHANFGKRVYDECLHGKNGGKKEPGYLSSMEKGFDRIEQYLGQKTTTDMWLDVHKCAFSHHDGSLSGLGELRPHNRGNYVDVASQWACHPRGMHPEAVQQIEGMGWRMCLLDWVDEGEPGYTGKQKQMRLRFLKMKRKRKRHYMDFNNKYLYHSLRHANDDDDKLRAICLWHQTMLRLEPAGDANTRTTVLFLNKHLLEAGFDPVILYWPDGGTVYSLNEMVEVVKESMEAWRWALAHPGSSKVFTYTKF